MTLKKFFELVNSGELTRSNIPPAFHKDWDFTVKATEDFTSDLAYQKSDSIRKAIDNFLNELEDKMDAPKPKPTSKVKTIQKVSPSAKPSANPTRSPMPTGTPVESFPDEYKFIKRYLSLHGKVKSRNHFRIFVNAIQRAIREHRIRKTSPYAKQVMEIQDSLIQQHANFSNDTELVMVSIPEATRTKYSGILGKKYEMFSIKLIKSYIGLQGKVIDNIQAMRLQNRISLAIEKGKVAKRDPYFEQLKDIRSSLEAFVKKNKKNGVLKIEEQVLNGLELIAGCPCEELNGFAKKPKPLDVEPLTERYYQNKKVGDDLFIMNSEDFEKVRFEHLGLKGKWREFIGDPEIGFRAMTYGFPKMGKSYLMIEFAGYLAQNHGNVLYVAKEEGKSSTLKQKLGETASSHSNMTVSNYIPHNLEMYDFVFLDSVTKLKLTPENLTALDASFPNTSFIEIHQVTKQGSARGKNDFSHDADVLINVSEKGVAQQNGRFNQGGVMNFFKPELEN